MCSGISGVVCSAIPVHTSVAASSRCRGRAGIPRLVGTIDLEPLVGAPVLRGQPEIVEHRADIEQLGS